jgi:AcrR family transcriptional regulator
MLETHTKPDATQVVEKNATTAEDTNMGNPTGGIGRPPKLNRAVIVAAAIDIADRHGLGAVTMRAVAVELDSTAAALYRHVKNREELVDLVHDEVLTERSAVKPTGEWRADLRVFALSLLQLHNMHPWLATGGLPTRLGPRGRAVTEAALCQLDPHPARRGQKLAAVAICFELVSGFARHGGAAAALSADIAAPAERAGGDHSEHLDSDSALAIIVAAVAGVLEDEEVASSTSS